jgi:hypothetical protein
MARFVVQNVDVTALISHAVVDYYPNATKGVVSSPNAAWSGFAVDLLNAVVANLK